MQIGIKLAGCFCIIAAGWMTGWELERRLRQRWMFLKEMQELFLYLEKEMTYHRTTVETALREAAGNCATVLRDLLLTAADQVEQRRGELFRDIWEDAVRQTIPGSLLQQDQHDTVCEAAAALCGTDTVMQRTMLVKYAERFDEMSRQESQNCQEKGKLYRKLSTAAGVFIVIVLI